ncbi:MAG: T9SS type A sorting domain-containing protein [Bacteroidia bacterium]
MLTANIGRLDSVNRTLQSNDLVAAEAINGSITEDNAMEENSRFINSLIIKKLAVGDTLDASDTTALESIFEQHWLVAGLSVYQAAALLGKEYYSPELPALRKVNNNIPDKPNDNDDVSGAAINMYPNPATGEIYFAGELPDDATVKIYDVTGRVVLLKTYSSRIDVTGLEEGFYMVKIYHDNKMLFNNILVKIK